MPEEAQIPTLMGWCATAIIRLSSSCAWVGGRGAAHAAMHTQGMHVTYCNPGCGNPKQPALPGVCALPSSLIPYHNHTHAPLERPRIRQW